MKDYEKGAIAIGVAALGFAAYQAIKTKEAVDATQATDPKKNPVTVVVELAENVIGDTTSYMRQIYDDATGRLKGKSENVVNWVTGGFNEAGNFVYGIGSSGLDFGKDAVEAGTKYLWGLPGQVAKSGKEKVQVIGNKGFTLMGNTAAYLYNAARSVPKQADTVGNVISGIGSKLEETTKKKRNYLSYIAAPFHRIKAMIRSK